MTDFLSELSLPYVAGIVDGEGYVSVIHRPKRRRGEVQVVVMVSMTFEQIPRMLQAQFGGCLYVQSRVRRPNHKTQYCWAIRSKQAAAFVKQILPYLIVKKRQAEIVIELDNIMLNKYKTPGRRGLPLELVERRVALAEEAKVLNSRGVCRTMTTPGSEKKLTQI